MLRRPFQRVSFWFFLLFSATFECSGYMPAPNKVVILILENHTYNQIAGSASAPYINGLLNDTMTAVFSQSYGLSYPSQPNYIQLFSGSNQGVINNTLPVSLPFTTPNLYAELTAASKTFTAYSQGLPFAGYPGEASIAYTRKHAPWVNWQGTGTNGMPSTLHQPFSAFPSNYNNLPNVSFVVPDMNNDMHSGSDPARIIQGDTWIQNNLNNYIQWARTNNSLLIVTFDEDDAFNSNRILTFFFGPMVQPGNYTTHIDHYNVLRTIEDLFGTTHAGAAATAAPIDFCWKCPQQLTISAGGPLTFCAPNTVTLTAATGNNYLWSNGSTTQSILVNSTGNFNCRITASTGCFSISNTLTSNVNRLPLISTFTPGGTIGSQQSIDGSSFTGSTLLKLNGVSIPFTIVNDFKITYVVPPGAATGFLQITNGCGPTQTVNQFVVVPQQIQLNLKFLAEGYYKGNGVMRPIINANSCDTFTVELLKQGTTSTLLYTGSILADTNGSATINLPGELWGNECYIIVSGRNILKTWSSTQILLTTNYTYDFTTSASKSFGNNVKNLGNNLFGFYSGDINQDGTINLTDADILKNSILSFTSGYDSSDLTGDGITESADWSLMENNITLATVQP